ncbi:lytic transglycosylase domain-containing protein [Fibrella sp. HMF5335]|uniref:Lytic transglycosylase domain-containing protein n=1 Tax=Fibrella rubiginis TaxID=2817060 RepID=A0A939K2X8_9BACT|nr:lytic transglycosylase domain-containing protein [Fibrella rubiginis]MBO0935048.1 lytic transglycosylase domain-containing protein [Fibrella rubiginis]
MAVARPAAAAITKLTHAPLVPKSDSRKQPVRLISTDLVPLERTLTEVELPLLNVDFCGESMPLDQADVLSRWRHVFTLFRPHSASIGDLRQRADAFFPLIDSTLAAYDIPADFKYIPLAESGLKARAVSPKGAGGYWQLMPGTARDLGLKVGGKHDERFNTKKATVAACQYLRRLYDIFGSWSLVAAAYNVGPGYVKKQLARQAKCDYYQMKLPRETRYYLFRVLLYKELLSRPEDYSSFFTPAPLTTFRLRPGRLAVAA